ncbi:MAG: hypothetical protein LBR56_02900, partial [Sporomusaceae bacterium]|nr:hypothetical protein [Sporomusaceae bacterium]
VPREKGAKLFFFQTFKTRFAQSVKGFKKRILLPLSGLECYAKVSHFLRCAAIVNIRYNNSG